MSEQVLRHKKKCTRLVRRGESGLGVFGVGCEATPSKWMINTLYDMLKLRRLVLTQSSSTALTGACVLNNSSSTRAGEGVAGQEWRGAEWPPVIAPGCVPSAN